MSKRLEEVKHFLDLINFIPRDSRGMGEMDVVNVQEDMQWLIERVQEFENHIDHLYDNNVHLKGDYRLQEQNKRYREALEFYADENNYREQELKGIVPPRSITFKPILHDYGSIARQALEGEE